MLFWVSYYNRYFVTLSYVVSFGASTISVSSFSLGLRLIWDLVSMNDSDSVVQKVGFFI